MKDLLELLFGYKMNSANNADINTKLHSIIPSQRPSFDDWCIEFKVSMLHGKQSMKNY